MQNSRKEVKWKRPAEGYERAALPDSETVDWELFDSDVRQLLLEYLIWLRDNFDRVWKAVDRLEQWAVKQDSDYESVLSMTEAEIDSLSPGPSPGGGQSGPGD
jgi:hypothetical protein